MSFSDPPMYAVGCIAIYLPFHYHTTIDQLNRAWRTGLIHWVQDLAITEEVTCYCR